jgi:hypothetical protein
MRLQSPAAQGPVQQPSGALPAGRFDDFIPESRNSCVSPGPRRSPGLVSGPRLRVSDTGMLQSPRQNKAGLGKILAAPPKLACIKAAHVNLHSPSAVPSGSVCVQPDRAGFSAWGCYSVCPTSSFGARSSTVFLFAPDTLRLPTSPSAGRCVCEAKAHRSGARGRPRRDFVSRAVRIRGASGLASSHTSRSARCLKSQHRLWATVTRSRGASRASVMSLLQHSEGRRLGAACSPSLGG